MRAFRAAVVQLRSTGNIRPNLDRASGLIRAAADEGADLVALPENFAWIRVPGAEPPPVHPLHGPLVQEMQALARDCRCHLLLGGFPEEVCGQAKYHNAAALLAPSGDIIATYRKRHLFDVELEDLTIRESDFNLPGDDVVCASCELGVIGLSICYDLRFPEHYRELVDCGAEILAVPAAFTAPTGQAHWHVLLRARATENQCFVIAPGQVGHHGGDRESYGHSLIVDPWGEVLAEIDNGEGFAVADLDPARLQEVRRRLPALGHRRS
jgi:predicted amidohydrolase